MNIEVDRAISDYVLRYVRLRTIADRVASNAALSRFFDAAPGVAETVTLAKLEALVAGRRRAGRAYDPIFVDLDSSGHALMLLELPRVLDGLLGAGALRRMVHRARSVLWNRATTALHLVALPAGLVVQETLELHQRLRDDHAVHVGALFVNQMPARPLTETSARLLPRVKARAIEGKADAVLRGVAIAEASVRRHADALTELGRLRDAIHRRPLTLPDVWTASSASDVAARLADEIDAATTGHHA